VALWICVALADGVKAADPLFDLEAIQKDPVEEKVLSTETVEGVVFQEVEYTSRVVNGAPERVQGILAFPEGGKKLPGVFWSMGGMAPASRFFPGLLAKKGYACLAVTLPHKLRNSFLVPFNTKDPASANLTLLARDQLRGITLLSQRPEVDPDRLAVAGASYGGVFATLIAGADPRIKAGFSFFGGGHHELGTNLPQFQKMETLEDVETWGRTIDPAFRLKQKAIPFLWGIAFNDQWFFFPAVTRTFMEAAGTEKRAFIMPHWRHGFPPEIDETLFNFLDTTPVAAKPRPAYNSPGPVTVREEGGRAVASFEWTGGNAAAKAEVVVSYGEDTPWFGWTHRAAFILPASVEGKRATARIPVPSRQLPLIAWGNLTDANGFLVSTPPLVLGPAELAKLPEEASLDLNCFVDGDLGEKAQDFYQRAGDPLLGKPEKDAACSGGQSWRVDPVANEATPGKRGKRAPSRFTIRLFHQVPGLAHRLTVRLKAERPTSLSVRLLPVRPPQWASAAVKLLVAKDPRLAPLLPRWADPVEPLVATANAGPEWQDVALDVPKPAGPIDGHVLEVVEAPENQTTYWIDTVRMQPVWRN
jgi:dienelactone hydrolase